MSPLRQRDCLLLFCAQLASGFGDWAGRLALSVVVYDRSNSALWAASVTAVSLVPWVGPGQVIATFADRIGRVAMMVGCDVSRAFLFLVLLVDMPLPVVLCVAFLAGLLAPPFAAARSAAMVEVVEPEMYGKALKLWGATHQFEAIVGFALGGVLVAAAGVETAIVLNAATFLVSAAFLLPLWSSTASVVHGSPQAGLSGLRAGADVWRRDPYLRRALVMFVSIGAFSVLPEALAVAFVAETDLPDAFVGLLIAGGAAWSLVVMARLPDLDSDDELLVSAGRRTSKYGAGAAVLFLVVAAASGAIAFFDADGWSTTAVAVVALVSYAVAGGLDSIGVPTNQVVGRRLPGEGRTTAMSVGMGAAYSAQAVLILAVGAVATFVPVAVVLSVSMAGAALLSLWLARGGSGDGRAASGANEVAAVREASDLQPGAGGVAAIRRSRSPWPPPDPRRERGSNA